MRSAGLGQSNSACSGYTLIELMVSSLILGITITGVMSMLGSGREIERQNGLRRQARTIAFSKLEDTLYHYSRYTSLGNLYASTNVTLDSGTTHPVTATLTLYTYWDSLSTDWNDSASIGTTRVPFKEIQVTVAWPSTSPTDSIYLQKRITWAQ